MLRRIPEHPNVAFIVTPVVTLRDSDGFVSTSRPRFPPMPEMMLAATLRQIDPEIRITIRNLRAQDADRVEGRKAVRYYDRKMEEVWVGAPFEEAREEVAAADVVCVSNNFTQNAGITTEFLDWARGVNPKAVLIVGGSDVAARSEHYLKSGADIVVLAEGESRLPAVLRQLASGEDLASVPKIAYRPNGNGKVVITSQIFQGRYLRLGSDVKNRDAWATDMNTAQLPALDLVDVEHFSESGEGLLIPGVSPPIMHFESSRGCHECCTFCATPNLAGTDFRHARPSGCDRSSSTTWPMG